MIRILNQTKCKKCYIERDCHWKKTKYSDHNFSAYNLCQDLNLTCFKNEAHFNRLDDWYMKNKKKKRK